MKSWSIKPILLAMMALVTICCSAADLKPSHVVVQAGGGMGIVSTGAGWSYGKCKRWETDLFVGFTPKYESSSAKAIVAIKENFVPWKLELNRRFTLEPLSVSLYLTSVASDSFWSRQPSRYPARYYILSPRYRINLALGQRINLNIPRRGADPLAVSAFYELSTCDIYLASAFGNSYLKPWDWLQLCLGIRFNI